MTIAHNQSQQIVTFTIDDKAFGIEVEKVKEIKGWQAVTPLPHAPVSVLGVINLRGMILPVYDLRIVIGLAKSTPAQSHVIVVVNIDDRIVGLLVDTVSDIIDITDDQIRAAPSIVGPLEHIRAIIVQDDSMITLLNMQSVINEQPQVATL